MKVVINRCFGGFSLSKAATKRLAELKGRKCFFFRHAREAGSLTARKFERDSDDDKDSLFWFAFDTEDISGYMRDDDDYKARNAWYEAHAIDNRPSDRTDPHLIQVVEEMGSDADGACAKLAIVEIPDGVEWEIDEYDGNESISEKHRSWS